MTEARLAMGVAGEEAALRHLRSKGYKLLAKNLRLGRLGELDLVMKDGPTLVFVEVKAMLKGEAIRGLDKIHVTKQRKLAGLAAAYLQRHSQVAQPYSAIRFDAVEVSFPDSRLRSPALLHLPDAFRC